MPPVEAPTGHVVRSRAKSASSSFTTSLLPSAFNTGDGSNPWNRLPLDDDHAVVRNFIAGNLVGVDFRKGARS